MQTTMDSSSFFSCTQCFRRLHPSRCHITQWICGTFTYCKAHKDSVDPGQDYDSFYTYNAISHITNITFCDYLVFDYVLESHYSIEPRATTMTLTISLNIRFIQDGIAHSVHFTCFGRFLVMCKYLCVHITHWISECSVFYSIFFFYSLQELLTHAIKSITSENCWIVKTIIMVLKWCGKGV